MALLATNRRHARSGAARLTLSPSLARSVPKGQRGDDGHSAQGQESAIQRCDDREAIGLRQISKIPCPHQRSAGRESSTTKKTLTLRRYILGLALTAFTHNPSGYLRQGCLLVLDPKKPREFAEVYPDGKRNPATVTHESALQYATEAARAFGVVDASWARIDPIDDGTRRVVTDGMRVLVDKRALLAALRDGLTRA